MDWLQSCTLPFRACKFAKPFLFLSTSSLLDADFGPSIYAVSSDKSSSLLSRRSGVHLLYTVGHCKMGFVRLRNGPKSKN